MLQYFLYQTELERERIALELEEEKKTQAEWEKRVKEQAKKIENLSSMVLFSNRDETREHVKKVFFVAYAYHVHLLICMQVLFYVYNFLPRSSNVTMLCLGYVLQIKHIKCNTITHKGLIEVASNLNPLGGRHEFKSQGSNSCTETI